MSKHKFNIGDELKWVGKKYPDSKLIEIYKVKSIDDKGYELEHIITKICYDSNTCNKKYVHMYFKLNLYNLLKQL